MTESLYEKEQEQNRYAKEVKTSTLCTREINPVKVLCKGEYIRLPNGSYIREFDEGNNHYRYHGYIVGENKIEFHTDLIKEKKKRVIHRASRYKVRTEIRRLRKFLPQPPLPTPPDSKKLSRRQRYPMLHYEAMVKALEELKELNNKPKKTWWQKVVGVFKK